MYIAIAFKGIKKYYFTGKGFESYKREAKQYYTLKSLKSALKPFIARLPCGYGIKAEKIAEHPKKKKKVKRKTKRKSYRKNPVKLSKAAKIEEAMRRYKSFSGHDPKFIDEHDLQKLEVGFKIGMCDGVMYTTVRDGKTERYIHEFKERARPILASNYDGSRIGFVDGNYSFTERGIVDN